MKVAVVILNWNGSEMLRRFLPSVVQYSSLENVEICVADNASSDDSCSIVAHDFPMVRLIRLDRNYGFAEGYNRALSQIESEYVVLLNSDVEVTEGWLETMVDYMDAHTDVVACQPKVLSWSERDRFEYAGACGGYIDRYGYPFCRGRIFNVIEKDKGQYDSIRSVFWTTGAALFMRLAAYRAVGGLDSRFFAHMEEIDMCWRLRSRGMQLVCIPQSVVYHVGGGTLNKESPYKTFLNFRNNLLMLYKNLPQHELNVVLRVRKYLDFLAAMLFLLQGNWLNAKAVFRARKEFGRMQVDFKQDRLENLSKATMGNIPERYSFSIIWQSKIKCRRFFSLLK